MATTLIIPGLDGSDRGHWQQWWLRNDPNAMLVEQSDWRRPCPHAWGARLIEAVTAHPYSWLVAHSLGVALVVRVAAERLDLQIAGALLVAPAEVDEGRRASERVAAFAPMSLAPLPFPAMVVASRSDRCMQFRRTKAFADAWRAQFVDYGDAGHINASSGFGAWPEGPQLLGVIQTRRRHTAKVIPMWPRPVASADRSAVRA